MTGVPEKNRTCPLCGGRLNPGLATIPFIFPEAVIVVKDVPSEICSNCHEAFTDGSVTGRLADLLAHLRRLKTEVSIMSYNDATSAAAQTG